MGHATKRRVESSRALYNRAWERNDFYRPMSALYSLIHKSDIAGKSVLEIGCGDLSFSYGIIDAARRYVGVDISDVAIRRGETVLEDMIRMDEDVKPERLTKILTRTAEKYRGYRSKTSLLACAACELGPIGQLVDTVIAIDTMPLLGENFQEAIRRISLTMAHGGVINFNICHTDWYLDEKEKRGVTLRWTGRERLVWQSGRQDLIAFSPKGIAKALTAVGLKPKEVKPMTEEDEQKLIPDSARIAAAGPGALCQMPKSEKPGVPKFLMVRAVKE